MNPKESLRERQDEVRVGRMWRAIEARRRPEKRRHRAAFIAATMVAAAVSVAVWLWPTPAPEGPLTLAETEAPVPTAIEAERTLSFADGSRVAAGEGTRLDLLENTASELAFALRRGAAHFEVEPGGPRRWRVAAGEVEVIVVGTVFDVERSDESVTVSVSRGAVRVRGPGVRDGEQRIEAGGELVVEPPSVDPPAVEEPVEEPPEEAPATVVVAPPAPPPSAPEPPSARELLADADAARASGDVREAVHLLERVWREHPRDSRAPLAAFTQGRLELDRLHDSAGAAATLGHALELGLQAPLRETAQALRIDAWGRTGDRRVGAAAERFVADHPESEYLDDVRRWLPTEGEQ